MKIQKLVSLIGSLALLVTAVFFVGCNNPTAGGSAGGAGNTTLIGVWKIYEFPGQEFPFKYVKTGKSSYAYLYIENDKDMWYAIKAVDNTAGHTESKVYTSSGNKIIVPNFSFDYRIGGEYEYSINGNILECSRIVFGTKIFVRLEKVSSPTGVEIKAYPAP